MKTVSISESGQIIVVESLGIKNAFGVEQMRMWSFDKSQAHGHYRMFKDDATISKGDREVLGDIAAMAEKEKRRM